MDNLPAHKVEAVRETIEAVGMERRLSLRGDHNDYKDSWRFPNSRGYYIEALGAGAPDFETW